MLHRWLWMSSQADEPTEGRLWRWTGRDMSWHAGTRRWEIRWGGRWLLLLTSGVRHKRMTLHKTTVIKTVVPDPPGEIAHSQSNSGEMYEVRGGEGGEGGGGGGGGGFCEVEQRSRSRQLLPTQRQATRPLSCRSNEKLQSFLRTLDDSASALVPLRWKNPELDHFLFFHFLFQEEFGKMRWFPLMVRIKWENWHCCAVCTEEMLSVL